MPPDELPVRPLEPRSRPAHPGLVAAGLLRGTADPARPEPPGTSRPGQPPTTTDEVAERTQADTEFLAREIAGVRLALADVVTGEELRDQIDRLTVVMGRMVERLDVMEARAEKAGEIAGL